MQSWSGGAKFAKDITWEQSFSHSLSHKWQKKWQFFWYQVYFLLGSEDDGNDDDDDECDKLEVVQLQFVKLSGLVLPSLKMEFW